MKAIVLAEFLRFRKAALGMAVIQLLLLVLVHSVDWLMEGVSAFYHFAFVLNVFFAAVLGWFQWRSIVQKNRWAFYIHRPLPKVQLFAGIVLGAVALFTLSTLLPMVVGLTVLDWYTGGFIDGRLYLIVPFVLGAMMCAWLALSFAMLSPSKLAPLVLALPALLVTADAHGHWVFLTLVVVLGWLFYLCFSAFKPALESHETRPLPLLMSAIPMQYALFAGFTWLAGMMFQIGLIITDPEHNGSWNEYWKPGSFHHTEQMTDEALLAYGMELSGLDAIEPNRFVAYNSYEVDWYKPMLRNQLFYMDRSYNTLGKIWHQQTGENWYFSHSEMLFFGIRDRDGKWLGWMDKNGEVHQPSQKVADNLRFDEIPKTLDRHEFYVGGKGFVYEKGGAKAFVALEGEDRFISAVKPQHQQFAALGQTHFYLFKSGSNGKLDILAKIRYSSPAQNIVRVNTAEVNGQVYVSMLAKAEIPERYFHNQLTFHQVDIASGKVEHLSHKVLDHDWPDIYRYRGHVISPMMAYLHQYLWQNLHPYLQGQSIDKVATSHPLPKSIFWAMLLSGLLSMAVSAFFAKSMALSKLRTTTWIVVCGLTGIPGLLSFIFLNHFNGTGPPD